MGMLVKHSIIGANWLTKVLGGAFVFLLYNLGINLIISVI